MIINVHELNELDKLHFSGHFVLAAILNDF